MTSSPDTSLGAPHERGDDGALGLFAFLKAAIGYGGAKLTRPFRAPNAGLAWGGSGLDETLRALAPHGAAQVQPGRAGADPEIAAMIRFLDGHGVRRYPNKMRSLAAHLLGTWRILVIWNQPTAVTRAGLFHSVYGTDSFPLSLVPVSAREKLRALVGAEAEALVFLFCTIDRRELRRELGRRGAIPAGALAVRNWITGERLELTPGVVATLLAIEIANVAEQERGRLGGPGVWMASASEFAAMIRGCLDPPPAAFDGCTGRLQLADERRARRLYLRLTHWGAARAKARDGLREVATLNPFVPEPQLELARIAEGADDARRYAERALALLLQWGTTWDKRRRWEEMVAAARALCDPGPPD